MRRIPAAGRAQPRSRPRPATGPAPPRCSPARTARRRSPGQRWRSGAAAAGREPLGKPRGSQPVGAGGPLQRARPRPAAGPRRRSGSEAASPLLRPATASSLSRAVASSRWLRGIFSAKPFGVSLVVEGVTCSQYALPPLSMITTMTGRECPSQYARWSLFRGRSSRRRGFAEPGVSPLICIASSCPVTSSSSATTSAWASMP